jgi:hypothetical protein
MPLFSNNIIIFYGNINNNMHNYLKTLFINIQCEWKIYFVNFLLSIFIFVFLNFLIFIFLIHFHERYQFIFMLKLTFKIIINIYLKKQHFWYIKKKTSFLSNKKQEEEKKSINKGVEFWLKRYIFYPYFKTFKKFRYLF